MSKITHGGKRKGAGRKSLPANKKKQVVQIYEPAEIIEAAGGLEAAKYIASTSINKVAARWNDEREKRAAKK